MGANLVEPKSNLSVTFFQLTHTCPSAVVFFQKAECSLIIIKVKKRSHSVMSDSLRPCGLLAHQAPQSTEFSRQEYWSGLPFPSPGIFPTQGSNSYVLCLLHWQVNSLPLVPPGKPLFYYNITSWQIDGETTTDFIFGGIQSHCRWWLQPRN